MTDDAGIRSTTVTLRTRLLDGLYGEGAPGSNNGQQSDEDNNQRSKTITAGQCFG